MTITDIRPNVTQDKSRPSTRSIPYNPYQDFSDEQLMHIEFNAQQVLRKFQKSGGSPNIAKIDFSDLGRILTKISQRKDINENTKVALWSKVVDSHGKTYITNLKGAHADIKGFRANQSEILENVLVNFNSDIAKLASHDEDTSQPARPSFVWQKLKLQYSTKGILGMSLNKPGINSAFRQIQALQAYLQYGFTAYATKWNELFLAINRF